jgi:hypothetical protein
MQVIVEKHKEMKQEETHYDGDQYHQLHTINVAKEKNKYI